MYRVALLWGIVLTLQVYISLGQQQIPNDIVTSGKYTIQSCGSQAPEVQTALYRLWTLLQPAIQDTRSSTPSAAYRTFFKTKNYSGYVRRVLSNIANGKPLASKLDSNPSTPRFVCVTGPGTVGFRFANKFYDVYEDCRLNPRRASVYKPGLNIVFICPIYFNKFIPSQPQRRCPTVDPETNKFVGDLAGLVQSKPYVLLHALAHFYVVPPSTENTQLEVYDWNGASTLEAREATVNAQSYVLYAASVEAGCTAFPTSQLPHSRGRHLNFDTGSSNLGLIGSLWPNLTRSAGNISLWLNNTQVPL